MEIQYQNTQADFKAYYEELWGKDRSSRRTAYYHGILWCLAVLALAGYIALKHDEIFVVCIFATLAGFYLKNNWSFAQAWNAQTARFAEMIPECSCTLLLDEAGATERFSGVVMHVPWDQIHNYSVTEACMFIHFLKYRSFVIPLRYLTSGQRDDVIKILGEHGKDKKV